MQNNKRLEIINIIKKKTGEAPDITYKDFIISKETITFIFSNSVSSQDNINDFLLRRLDEASSEIKIKDLYEYIKNYVPNNSIKEISTISDALYYLMSGFTVTIFNNGRMLVLENKAKLFSDVSKSENEKGLKGPSDAFCENYQINTGMIRRRIKSENLWIKEKIVGKKSKTKVGIFYMNGMNNEKIVKTVEDKLDKIDIDYVGNGNYVIEAMSNTNRFLLPTTLTTQRPDQVALLLTQGRIALVVENTSEVIILPCLFLDFFKTPEDYYEKSINVFLSRIIRFIAFFLAIFTPAIYISLMAYNWEALPSGLLVNFSIQREGVPFTSLFEILVMSLMFQILKESDLRFPGKGASSLSIVGALVLGQAAVEAGIVSPITIIVVGVSSVSSLAFSSIELINSSRWWQLLLILLSGLFGFVGIIFGTLIILATILMQNSCGVPYFAPFEPFNVSGVKDAISPTKKQKFHPKSIFNKGDTK